MLLFIISGGEITKKSLKYIISFRFFADNNVFL